MGAQRKRGIGDNSSITIESEELRKIVHRIEALNEEIAGIQDDRKDVFSEAKGMGFDATTIRELIRLRKLDPEVREERRTLLDVYLAAFGVE